MQYPHDSRRRYGQWASRFADTVGDGSGSIAANVNGSVTPVDLHYTSPAGAICLIDELIVFIQDGGTMSSIGYGGLAALTNGIQDGVTTPEGMFIPSGDLSIKSIGDWASLAHSVSYNAFGGGDPTLTVKYRFVEDGAPILVPPGHSFTVRIRDNLTGLSAHRFRIGAVQCPDSSFPVP